MPRPIVLLWLVAALLSSVALAAAQPTGKAPPRRMTVAGTHRSPEVARRLALVWYDAILPAAAKHPLAEQADAKQKPLGRLPLDVFRKQVRGKRLRPRPAVIHVFDPSFKMGELLRLEYSVFSTEPLLIAATFTDNFRLKEGPGLPAGFWLTDAAGRVVARLPLNTGRNEIQAKIALVFAGHYEGKLEAAVAAYAAWLVRLEAAEDAVARERTPAAAVTLVRTRRTESEARPKRRPPPKKPPAQSPPSK